MHKKFPPLWTFTFVSAKAAKATRKKLGTRIRKLRKEQGISQSQLAFECGVRREVVTRLELGQQNATIDTLCGIAAALNMELKDLFNFE